MISHIGKALDELHSYMLPGSKQPENPVASTVAKNSLAHLHKLPEDLDERRRFLTRGGFAAEERAAALHRSLGPTLPQKPVQNSRFIRESNEIVRAVLEGNLEKLKLLIEQDLYRLDSFEYLENKGKPALFHALSKHFTEIVSYLRSKGASFDTLFYYSQEATFKGPLLGYYADQNATSYLDWLADERANLHAVDSEGNTVLERLIEKLSLDSSSYPTSRIQKTIEKLISLQQIHRPSASNLSAECLSDQSTAISYAARYNPSLLRKLVEKHNLPIALPPRSLERQSLPVLPFVLQSPIPEHALPTCRYLLSRNPELLTNSFYYSKTPAARYGSLAGFFVENNDLEGLNIAISLGADLHTPDFEGKTPLKRAIEKINQARTDAERQTGEKLAKTLIYAQTPFDQNAPFHQKCDREISISYAASRHRLDLLEMLIPLSSCPFDTPEYLRTGVFPSVIYALDSTNESSVVSKEDPLIGQETASFLLQNGAPISLFQYNMNPSYHGSFFSYYIDNYMDLMSLTKINQLVGLGIDLQIKDSEENTPLLRAIKHLKNSESQEEIAQLTKLLSNMVDFFGFADPISKMVDSNHLESSVLPEVTQALDVLKGIVLDRELSDETRRAANFIYRRIRHLNRTLIET